MRITADKNLALHRASYLRMIDQAAEAARAQHITPGAGQAIEYAHTLDEAKRVLNNADEPGPFEMYPFLDAAKLSGESVVSVAHRVMKASDASYFGLAAIKRARHEAKARITPCETVHEMDEVFLSIDWM